MDPVFDNNIILDNTYTRAIILGTGIKESVLSAAISFKNYVSTNLDTDKSYSSSMKTYNLKEMISFFNEKEDQKEDIQESQNQCVEHPNEGEKFKKILKKSSCFIKLNFSTSYTEDEKKKHSKSFNIDLQPRLLYSRSLTVDKMVDAKMDQYMDFRAIDGIFFYDNEVNTSFEKCNSSSPENEKKDVRMNKFLKVKTNKTDIFNSSEFSLIEKRDLFKFLHLCVNLQSKFNDIEIDNNSIEEYDKDLDFDDKEINKLIDLKNDHFSNLISKFKLSTRLVNVIVYVIANYLSNYQNSKDNKNFTTESFINRICKFIKSAGIHTVYPYLYTNYGTSDILQGFSRISAVMGSIFIINQTIKIDRLLLKAEVQAEEYKSLDTKEEESSFYLETSLAGPKKYLRTSVIVTNKDHLPLFNVKELENAEEGSRLLRGTRVFEFPDNIYKAYGPRLYYIMPNNDKIKNYHPIVILVVNSSSSSAPDNHVIIYIQTILKDENDLQAEELADRITEFLCNELFITEDTAHHILRVQATYIQKKRKFEQEKNLNDIKGLVILEDDGFELDLDEEFKQSNLHYEKLLDTKEKMQLSRTIEENDTFNIQDEEEEDNELMNLLDDLDKLKMTN